MDQATTERIKREIEFEFGRTEPPEGFPSLPDIPAQRYIDPGFFDLERRLLWPRAWLFAAHVGQLPEPGSFLLWEASGVPVLLVRGEDERIRAFFNTCRHRGAPVVREPCGRARRLRCHYHSWVYDLDGSLHAVPDERDFVALEKAQRGLIELRCETWGGWIFVNRDAEAPALATAIGPVPAELEDLEVDKLRFVTSYSLHLECNWKASVEAFLEVYHLKHIHADTVDKFLDHRGAAMGLLPGGHSRMATPVRPEILVDGNVPSPFSSFGRPGEIPRITNLAYNLFPNLVTPLDITGFPFLLFWPLDIRTTRLDVLWFGGPDYEPEEDGSLPVLWQKRKAAFDLVLDEDTENLAAIQKSLESGGFRGIPLNYQERRLYHLHEQIDRTMGIDDIPATMRVQPRLVDWVEPVAEGDA
ncbi:MAG: aromatic ring-hydroxylating dioxygenase subunit alpha [Acidobacteriota bacterium]|nr:aromatic ring-hydroxylating dioxygenase subunit alpha [Acidobacteriota bacterium]